MIPVIIVKSRFQLCPYTHYTWFQISRRSVDLELDVIQSLAFYLTTSVLNNSLIVASCATQVVHYTLYLNTACADTYVIQIHSYECSFMLTVYIVILSSCYNKYETWTYETADTYSILDIWFCIGFCTIFIYNGHIILGI